MKLVWFLRIPLENSGKGRRDRSRSLDWCRMHNGRWIVYWWLIINICCQWHQGSWQLVSRRDRSCALPAPVGLLRTCPSGYLKHLWWARHPHLQGVLPSFSNVKLSTPITLCLVEFFCDGDILTILFISPLVIPCHLLEIYFFMSYLIRQNVPFIFHIAFPNILLASFPLHCFLFCHFTFSLLHATCFPLFIPLFFKFYAFLFPFWRLVHYKTSY